MTRDNPFHALALGAFLLALAPRPMHAQSVAGEWTTEVPVRVSSENGVERVEETRTARITITQQGDGVRAVWRMEGGPGEDAPRPRTLSGTLRDDRLMLTDTVRAYVRSQLEAEAREVLMIHTYELRLDGDTLRGHVRGRSEDGRVDTQPREFVAVRS